MIVSEVGRITNGSASFSPPAVSTIASSGENPAKCSFSFLRSEYGMKRGKYTFWTPSALNQPSSTDWSFSQIAKPHGLIIIVPLTSPYSARPALNTTSWYQSEMFSDFLVSPFFSKVLFIPGLYQTTNVLTKSNKNRIV